MKTMNCSIHGNVSGIIRWENLSDVVSASICLVEDASGVDIKNISGLWTFIIVDPAQKSFSLSVKGLCYAWDTILKEAKKCVLLCKNCHAEIEAGL